MDVIIVEAARVATHRGTSRCRDLCGEGDGPLNERSTSLSTLAGAACDDEGAVQRERDAGAARAQTSQRARSAAGDRVPQAYTPILGDGREALL